MGLKQTSNDNESDPLTTVYVNCESYMSKPKTYIVMSKLAYVCVGPNCITG